MGKDEHHNLPLIWENLGKYELSTDAKAIIMASWRPGTSKQYKTYLDKWQIYCRENKIDVFKPGLVNAIEFLVTLYKSGIGYSAINTARSALSNLITLENGMKFGEHPLVTRYMKGIFEIRPALPKYSEIWDVTVVLNYLKTFVMVTALPLKELTLKLTMLLCLTTEQRGQTIHKMEVSGIQALPDRYRIKHLAPIDLLAFPEEERLCVVKTLKEYLQRTYQHRDKHSQLLLSYIQPFKPVSKETIARWAKVVLKSAGIDVTKYSAHSSRAASTSTCKAKGLTMKKIMAAAGWSNAGTFGKFYEKPVDIESQNFGRVLLKQ